MQDIQAVEDRLDAAGVPCSALVAAREHAARAHARATFPAIGCALQLIIDIQAWQTGLT